MDEMNLELQEGWAQLQAWVRKERIGRKQYVEVNVLSGVLGLAVIFAPFLIVLFLPDFNSNFLMLPVAAVGIATSIIMILVFIATSMARLRDIGYSTNWFVIGLIPYINAIFFLALALKEGKIARERAQKAVTKEESAASSESSPREDDKDTEDSTSDSDADGE